MEYNKPNEPPGLISYAEYLNNNYKQMTFAEYQKLEQKDKPLEELNQDIELQRLKVLCELTDAHHPGAKFRRLFEDMKKKLSLDAKIKRDYFPDNEGLSGENKEKTGSKPSKENIDLNNKESKETIDNKENKENKETKENKDSKEIKESKETINNKESKSNKESKENISDNKESKEKVNVENKESKENIDNKENKENKENTENKENKDNKDINSNQDKLNPSEIMEEKSKKFSQLGEDITPKEKFKYIFRNSYHRIILSFFTMMINLKKIKQDFVLVFRFFGSDESSIEEFIYEFNNFCDCAHPRFCGEYGFSQFKIDVEKDKKNYKIDTHTQEFISVSYRGAKEEEEKVFFDTMQQPNFHEIEEIREAIEEFYTDSNNQGGIHPSIGYKDIYLNFMDKITQNNSFCILDDYSYFMNNEKKHGKLFLIDPYDPETLQIFFDIELDKYPDKIDVIDVVTHKKLSKEYYLDKYVVNVEPYKAIIDINYFNKKIEECIHNRKSELLKMQGKEMPIIPNDQFLNYNQEMNNLPGDIYLEMTVLPLLANALNMCDMIRPADPISFIANFMLMNKDHAKKLEDVIRELPEKKAKKEEKIEVLIPEDVTDEKFEEEEVQEVKKEKSEVESKAEVVEEEKKSSKTESKKKESTKKSKSKVTSKASVNSKK
mgnify:CR=1 FL=1